MGKKWITTSHNDYYYNSLFLQKMDENNPINAGTWVANFEDEKTTYYPIIELDKDLLKYHIIKEEISNGSISVIDKTNAGEKVIISINPDIGYELDKITVFDKDNNKIEVIDNTFTMPNSNVFISATFKAQEYKFITSDNQVFNGEDLVFKIDAPYSLFLKVYINDEELDANNYTSKKGSTIITLSKEYLNTLEKGTYNIKATFTNGKVATSSFIINKEDVIENPSTGDNLVKYIIIFMISIIGIINFKKYLLKRR